MYSFNVGLHQEFYLSFLPILLFTCTLYDGSFLHLFKKLLFLNIFVLIVILSILFVQDYDLALLVFLRSNAILMLMLCLFGGRDFFEVSLGLQELRLPRFFVSLVFFSSKFIYLFTKEINKFKKTLHVRGFVGKTSWFTYQTYGDFIGMLILKSFYNAKKLSLALESRGFQTQIYTLKEPEKLNIKEISLMVVLLLSFLNIGKII